MNDRVFIYLRLALGEIVIFRSKIREFAALGNLLPQFLRQALDNDLELPLDTSGEPVLEYVDANTDQMLIRFRLDPVHRVQIVEGCIPPAYQARMLHPEASSLSIGRFLASAGDALSPEQQSEAQGRLADSNLLERIRETMDEEGNFLVRVPV